MVCYFCSSFQKHMLKKSMEYHQTNSPRQQQNQAWQASQQTTQQNAPYYPQGAAGSTTVEPTHVPGLDLNSSFNNNTLNSSGGQQQNINQLIGNPDDVQSRYKYMCMHVTINYFAVEFLKLCSHHLMMSPTCLTMLHKILTQLTFR